MEVRFRWGEPYKDSLANIDFCKTQFPADGRIQRVDKNEKLSLVFKVCELDDAGTYSVEITEFVKNGERDQTDCWLDVEGKIVANMISRLRQV